MFLIGIGPAGSLGAAGPEVPHYRQLQFKLFLRPWCAIYGSRRKFLGILMHFSQTFYFLVELRSDVLVVGHQSCHFVLFFPAEEKFLLHEDEEFLLFFLNGVRSTSWVMRLRRFWFYYRSSLTSARACWSCWSRGVVFLGRLAWRICIVVN